MMGITILYRQKMSQVKIFLKGEAEITYNTKRKRKTNKDIDYNMSHGYVKNEFSLVGLTLVQRNLVMVGPSLYLGSTVSHSYEAERFICAW